MGEEESAARSVNHRLITPGLLSAMRIPLLRGREFTDADGPAAEPVVIVSQHLARRLWAGGEALQKQVRLARAGSPWLTVVGVAGDVRDEGDLRDAWYLPYAQKADSGAAESFWLMVRSPAPDSTCRCAGWSPPSTRSSPSTASLPWTRCAARPSRGRGRER